MQRQCFLTVWQMQATLMLQCTCVSIPFIQGFAFVNIREQLQSGRFWAGLHGFILWRHRALAYRAAAMFDLPNQKSSSEV